MHSLFDAVLYDANTIADRWSHLVQECVPECLVICRLQLKLKQVLLTHQDPLPQVYLHPLRLRAALWCCSQDPLQHLELGLCTTL